MTPSLYFNRVTRDGQIRPVLSNERDVGSVQRGYKGQLALLWSGSEHLPRQQCAHRMRDRIMHVQQIEIVQLRNFGHPRGQRQIVRRIVEQRVSRDFYFVVVNVRGRAIQPNRLGVGNEVNVVPALRQFEAQFGGNYTATAVGGVTGDADFQAVPHVHSMGKAGQGFGLMAARNLDAFGGRPGKSLIHFFDVFLQALLDVIF